MLFFHSHVARNAEATVKVVHHARTGVQRLSEREYRGFRIEVWRRRLGVSVHRVAYSVSISDPENERAGYLSGFTAAEPAWQAAQNWVDQRLLQTPWGRRWPRPAAGRAGSGVPGTPLAPT